MILTKEKIQQYQMEFKAGENSQIYAQGNIHATDIETAQKGWAVVREMLQDPSLNLIVLDELTYPLKFGWLDLATVLDDLENRPFMQHVVITGRAAPDGLCEVADTVTEMKDVKHAFRAGIIAQKGIDL